MVTVVLLSGGIDSTYCAMHCFLARNRVSALFFDYRQPYSAQERKAVDYVARFFSMGLTLAGIGDLQMNETGKVPNRNETFIKEAIDCCGRPLELVLGIRNVFRMTDRFGDANLHWARQMRRKYNITISLPALGMPKPYLKWRLRNAGIDLNQLYSTEGYRPNVQIEQDL